MLFNGRILLFKYVSDIDRVAIARTMWGVFFSNFVMLNSLHAVAGNDVRIPKLIQQHSLIYFCYPGNVSRY